MSWRSAHAAIRQSVEDLTVSLRRRAERYSSAASRKCDSSIRDSVRLDPEGWLQQQPLRLPDEGACGHHRSTPMPQDTPAPHQDRRRTSRPGRLRVELIILIPLPASGRSLVVLKDHTAPSVAPDCTITPPEAGFPDGWGSDGRTEESAYSKERHFHPRSRPDPHGQRISVPTISTASSATVGVLLTLDEQAVRHTSILTGSTTMAAARPPTNTCAHSGADRPTPW